MSSDAPFSRSHPDVKMIAALFRGQALPQTPDQRSRLGASLRRVRDRLEPSDFQRWLVEDVRVPSERVPEYTAMCETEPAPIECLRPAELI